jgi:hypothetical protein
VSEADIPHQVPYVSPDAALVESWRGKIGASLTPRVGVRERALRIGIAWQGSPTFKGDQFRSIPLAHFAPLAQVSGVTLISLQKTAGLDQIAANRDAVPLTVFPDLDAAAPFVDTAAVMQHLDLIITSDTAIAHLAGALGRPVWVALGMDCDWRWGIGRADSPWYPTMRLFRQKKFGDWPGVFTEMAGSVVRWLGGEVVLSEHHLTTQPPNHLTCPVSAGELIDKITILEIKLERIADEAKRANVRRELELLRAARPTSIAPSAALRKLETELKAVNGRLWEIENEVRMLEAAGDFGAQFIALARSVYKENDNRAALKRQINEMLGSPIVEEKSYGG